MSQNLDLFETTPKLIAEMKQKQLQKQSLNTVRTSEAQIIDLSLLASINKPQYQVNEAMKIHREALSAVKIWLDEKLEQKKLVKIQHQFGNPEIREKLLSSINVSKAFSLSQNQ